MLDSVHRGHLLGPKDGAAIESRGSERASRIDGGQATRREFVRHSKHYVGFGQHWIQLAPALLKDVMHGAL